MQSMFYFIDTGQNIQVNFIFDAFLENQTLQGLSKICPKNLGGSDHGSQVLGAHIGHIGSLAVASSVIAFVKF